MREKEGSGELETKVADEFIEKHIIRREETRGAVWYELAHDRLIRPIIESNDAWLNLSENTYQRLAKKWVESGEKEDLLLAAHELPPAQAWLQQHGEASPRVKEFIKASVEKEDRRQDRQKIAETQRAKEVLQKQKAELEAQQEEILKLTATQNERLRASATAKIEYLQAKAYRRQINTNIILVVPAAIAASIFGFASYEGNQVRKLKQREDLAKQYIQQ